MSDTALALGFRDPATGRWHYLRRGAFVGNLVRTEEPFYAQVWSTVDEVRGWLDCLPEDCRFQLADRELFAVPLSIVAGEPTKRLCLRSRRVPQTDAERGRGDKPKREVEPAMILFGG